MAKYTVWVADENPEEFMQEFVDMFGNMLVTIQVKDERDNSLGIVCPYCTRKPYPEHVSVEPCARHEDL